MQIEIWSDVLCPWCAVGRARLQTAVEAVGEPVEIRWRSFELTPQAPRRVEGDYLRRLGDKYGWSPAKTRLMVDQMVETAAAHGLDFDFSIIRPGNTFDAHRLLHLAAERDCQDALKARFFQAYLGEGQPIGEPATLARLAVEVGLDADEVHTVLMSDAYGDAVRADERQAAEYGVRGVPFFVIDGRIGLSGAQPAEVIAHALRRAQATPRPAPDCGPTHCAI